MKPTRTLGILIFDEVEVLDFCGQFEVFSVASRFTETPAFKVLTVAEKSGPILTRGGLSVNPHHRLADCHALDLLLVPGGQGTRKEMHNPALNRRVINQRIDYIRRIFKWAVSEELVPPSVYGPAAIFSSRGLRLGRSGQPQNGTASP